MWSFRRTANESALQRAMHTIHKIARRTLEIKRIMHRSLIAGAIILASLMATGSGTRADSSLSAPPEKRDTFVFQVGIDKYTSPSVPKLDGCVRDILDMKQLLI